MSEMVERVAMNIAGVAWADLGDDEREYWLSRARAAIKAMSEPTRPMMGSGARLWYKERWFYFDARSAAKHIWQAMIDTALTESDQS